MHRRTGRRPALASPLAAALAACLALGASSLAAAQGAPSGPDRGPVLRFEELTTTQVARLDRAHTIVLLVGAILEEHGPYMPNGADLYRNVALADTLARAITALRAPDGRPWTVLRLPLMPIGARPFDESVGRRGFPGSVPVRAETERAVFMDLADQIGAQGFRRVLVVHGHGEPLHNRMLDQAGDYFRDTFGSGAAKRGAFMVHVLGRMGCQPDGFAPPPDSLLSAAARAENVDSPHADATELSRLLHLRPDLVDAGWRTGPSVVAAGPDAWAVAARADDWPGYIGAPRHASAALGAWNWAREVAGCSAVVQRVLEGTDERTLPRYADRMLAIPAVRATVERSGRLEAERAARQTRWLRAHATSR